MIDICLETSVINVIVVLGPTCSLSGSVSQAINGPTPILIQLFGLF
jgi:hypothetical protein